MRLKSLLSLAVIGLLIPLCPAQTRLVVASQFSNWRAAGSVNLIAGANANITVSPCQVVGGGINFNALAASTPIKIVDPNNPSIDEVLTPTSVSGCTGTFTTSNAHPTPWYIISGTQGLQEAINNGAQTGVMNVVQLDTTFFQFGGSASTIYAATGSPYLGISALPSLPNATWRWNGTHYISTYSLLGITAPTLAAGAAAGSSPTVANSPASNGNVWTASVTTGTATTTGPLFTETVATPPPSGNANCTVQSIGTNTPPPFTVGISAGVITVTTGTTAPTTATVYLFGGVCQ